MAGQRGSNADTSATCANRQSDQVGIRKRMEEMHATLMQLGCNIQVPIEAMFLSDNVSGSVICTLAAECRSFVLWSERQYAGRMLVRGLWMYIVL